MSVTTAAITFSVRATGSDLDLRVTLDNSVIWHGSPGADSVTVRHDLADADDADHVLSFELQGKLPEHTAVNERGEILQDRLVLIQDLAFDDIALGYMFTELAQYHHDTNGTTDSQVDQFHGIMGCNGRVDLKFSTPIYLWLLENM